MAWLAARGGTVARPLTDNALRYRWGAAGIAVCTELGRGSTAGPSGRRTLQTEWDYARARTSNDERTAALDSWLEHYNTAAATPPSEVAHRFAGSTLNNRAVATGDRSDRAEGAGRP